MTNTFLSRTNHVGSPWLSRSVTSGSAVHSAVVGGTTTVIVRSDLETATTSIRVESRGAAHEIHGRRTNA